MSTTVVSRTPPARRLAGRRAAVASTGQGTLQAAPPTGTVCSGTLVALWRAWRGDASCTRGNAAGPRPSRAQWRRTRTGRQNQKGEAEGAPAGGMWRQKAATLLLAAGTVSGAGVSAPMPVEAQQADEAPAHAGGEADGGLFNRNTPSVVNVTQPSPPGQDAFTLDVTEGGAEYPLKVVGADPDKDVAVLEIVLSPEDKQPELKPITLGTSADLVVGQKVYAIGNPFGLDHTLTTGVISGLGREINSGICRAPHPGHHPDRRRINPGNSGGPLIDSAGNLICINHRHLLRLRHQLRHRLRDPGGRSPQQRGADHPASAQLGVQGILVLDARKGGPAWKAGIKGTTRDDYGRLVIGDIIVTPGLGLVQGAGQEDGGDTLDLEVLRERSKEHVEVTLEESPTQKPTFVIRAGP
eukprot:jgi/Tetstr1/421014/TSEL_001097.t1